MIQKYYINRTKQTIEKVFVSCTLNGFSWIRRELTGPKFRVTENSVKDINNDTMEIVESIKMADNIVKKLERQLLDAKIERTKAFYRLRNVK